MSRARNRHKPPEPVSAGPPELASNVRVDAPKPHHNLGKRWTWREDTPGRKRPKSKPRYPTTPHPDNVAMVASWDLPEPAVPLREWLRRKAARMREQPNSQTSFFAWCGWHAAYESLLKRLQGAVRHPDDRPVSEATMQLLALALASLKRDLDDNSPFG